MQITDGMIAVAEKKHACQPALDWLRETPRTDRELLEQHPEWALWAAGNTPYKLSPTDLSRAAQDKPWTALQFAAELLSPTDLSRAAQDKPWTALKFAAELLSPTDLSRAAQAEPVAALQFAVELLSPTDLSQAAQAEPVVALRYCAGLLPPELREKLEAMQ